MNPVRASGEPSPTSSACRIVVSCFCVIFGCAAPSMSGAGVDDAETAFRRGDFAQAAREWLTAARGGHAEAQYRLGSLHAEGLGVARDAAAAFSWMSQAAQTGHVLAQYRLGLMHANGEGTERDYAVAAIWLTKAGRKGLAEAQQVLGHLYAFGYLGRRDLGKAQYWLELAAHQDMTSAQLDLAVVLMDVRRESEDREGARRWVARAAELGDAEALYRVARDHESSRDFPRAAALHQEAASKGHGGAQASLGRMYLDGDGVTIDYQRAFDLLCLAAAQGESSAFYNLGTMFEKGHGRRQDALLSLALRWAAREVGVPSGTKILQSVPGDLSASELASVERLATALGRSGNFRNALEGHLRTPAKRERLSARGQAESGLIERVRP